MAKKAESIEPSPPPYPTGPSEKEKDQSNEKTIHLPETVSKQPSSEPIPINAVKIDPARVTCPQCKNVVVTKTEDVAGSEVQKWSCICCLLLGVIGAILPLCVNNCKDVTHTCPRCGFKMAKHYRHDGHTKLYRLPKPPPAGA